MAKNIHRSKNYKEPIEKHDTAAWANIESLKPVSRVHLPSEIEVRNAKEYVDSNQK
jgi:hypothetical protein